MAEKQFCEGARATWNLTYDAILKLEKMAEEIAGLRADVAALRAEITAKDDHEPGRRPRR